MNLLEKAAPSPIYLTTYLRKLLLVPDLFLRAAAAPVRGTQQQDPPQPQPHPEQ